MATHPSTSTDEPRIKQLLREYSERPVYQCIADQGDFYCGGSTQELISTANDSVEEKIMVSPSPSPTNYDPIEEAVREVTPQRRSCYANALRMWAENPDFTYVEGVSVLEGNNRLFRHAWNLLDSALVDVTPTSDPFDEYFGIAFEDANRLSQYVEIGQETDVWGILGNHKANAQYLRDHGFI